MIDLSRWGKINAELHMIGIVVAMILLAVIGGYVVTSLILLRYPTLLHKKKDVKFRAVNIAHRGGSVMTLVFFCV